MHRPPRIQRLDPQQPLFDAPAGQAAHTAQTGVRLLTPDRIAGLAVLADAAELSDLLDALLGVAIDLAARAGQPGVVPIELAGNDRVEIRITAAADFAGTPDEGAHFERHSSDELQRRAQRLGGALSTRADDPVMRRRFRRLGADAVLARPLRLDDIACILRRALPSPGVTMVARG